MSVITIDHLKKYFGDVKAVDDVSFTVEAGEIFGFLGPNGAGKSTTISCVMAFIKQTDGLIHIFGKDAQINRTELKNDIGYLSSDVHLYHDRTGQDHINLYTAVKGQSAVLPQLLKDFSFNPNIKVAQLSTGNKQKLGVILCLMHAPKLLILDEPTRGLDPLLQKTFFDYLLRAKESGTTIFMSSHNLPEVDKFCDRIGIIKEGKLVTIETIASMREKHMYQIHVTFKTQEQAAAWNPISARNIVRENHHTISFVYTGDIDKILELISAKAIADISINHAALEDIFMTFYN